MEGSRPLLRAHVLQIALFIVAVPGLCRCERSEESEGCEGWYGERGRVGVGGYNNIMSMKMKMSSLRYIIIEETKFGSIYKDTPIMCMTDTES